MKATFVAFDTETTGLHPESCEIIEVAGVKFSMEDDGSPRPISQFSSLVNIEGSIPPEASAINHIYDSMLIGAPKAREAIGKFFRWLGPSAIMIAHNASFDVSFLGNEVHRSGLMLPKNPVFCTRRMACRLYPELRHRLKDMEWELLRDSKAWEEKKRADGAHRALYDSMLLMHVFAEMLRRKIPKEDWSVERMLAVLPGMGGAGLKFDAPKNSHELEQEYMNTGGQTC